MQEAVEGPGGIKQPECLRQITQEAEPEFRPSAPMAMHVYKLSMEGGGETKMEGLLWVVGLQFRKTIPEL